MQLDRYVPPASSPLAPYVSSIWRVRAPASSYSRETILPKGNLDLLFNLGPAIAADVGHVIGTALAAEHAYVAGVRSHAFTSQPSDAVSLFGISLRMETCAALLPLPPGEIQSLIVDARDIFPAIEPIADRLAAAQTFLEQCRIVEGWLVARIAPTPAADFIAKACRWLDRRPNEARVHALAVDQRVSDRQVRRLFNAQLGFGAAYYVRLRRFIRAVHLMSSDRTLSDIACAAHYYDQPHLCREFRAIAGLSPGEYHSRRSPVPGHLFD